MASRRALLKAGAGTATLLMVRDALAQGRVERGIYRVRGDVRINGEPAREGAEARTGDTILTGANGEIVFVIARDAMLVRSNANVSLVADGLRAVTGAVLSVFASGQRKRILTETAAVGIRGTAVYIEAEAERTYVCTCYGEAVLEPRADPAARETVRTRHHEQPRYIMASGAPQMIMEAPVINHTDAELILLEGIVGRQPPFVGQGFRPY
jgi:hypothetical protein